MSHHVARLSPRALPHQAVPAPRAADRAGAGRDDDAHGLLRQRGDVLRDAGRAQAASPSAREAALTLRDRDRCRRRRTRRRGRRPPIDRRCRSRRSSACSTATSLRVRAPSSWQPTRARRSRPGGRCSRPSLDLTRASTGTSRSIPRRRPSRRRCGRLPIAARRLSGLRALSRSPACDRSGCPARYVSGYLETVPPPGMPRRARRRRVACLARGLLPGHRLDSTSIPRTTCCRHTRTSRSPGDATTATSARSTA